MANLNPTKRALIEGRAALIVIDIQASTRVIEDCVAGSSQEAHDASLRAMEYLQSGAVCALEDVKIALKGAKSAR